MSASPRPSLPASAPAFRYEGRFDRANPAGPVVIWAGSRIDLDFGGDTLLLHFTDAKGQNFFDADLDGHTIVFGMSEGGVGRVDFQLPPTPDGRHRLRLFKRSEAAAGSVRFAGATLKLGAPSWPPAPLPPRPRLLFLGDSITVGACNEDGATDQWESYRTHNHALSYATLTARALQADHQTIAVSGMGIVTGYVEPKAPEVWDRLYPVAGSARADLAAWTPDTVFLNFGENDDSFTRTNAQPFPTDAFVAGYLGLARAIRAAWSHARLVLLRGGMTCGHHGEQLVPAWEQIVAELQAGEPNVEAYAFQHFSELHPRTTDHHAMAAELVAWLKTKPALLTPA